MKGALRAIGAVIGGSLAIAITSFIADYLVGNVEPDVLSVMGLHSHPGILVLMLVYSTVFSALGGYVTAWLAGRARMKHVIALAIIQLVGGVAAAVQAGDMFPRWFSVAVVIVPVPAILAGGALRSRAS